MFTGSVTHHAGQGEGHRFRFLMDAEGRLFGASRWPADPARELPVRRFALRGRRDADARLEWTDDAPECIAGFRRGLYVGRQDTLSVVLRGQYYERDEASRELYYCGEWTAAPVAGEADGDAGAS